MLTLKQCLETEGQCFLHETGDYRIDTRYADPVQRYLRRFFDTTDCDHVWDTLPDDEALPNLGWMRVMQDAWGVDLE